MTGRAGRARSLSRCLLGVARLARLAAVAPVAVLLVLGAAMPAAALPQGKVTIAQSVDPTTLDPHWHEETAAYNVLLNVYDTLLFRDKDQKIIPWLAESWKLVNPTTWEFRIRRGVKFHDGEDLDADAVKWSLDRLRDPELGNRQAGNFRLVKSVEAVDKFTVRIVTSKPFPTLENQLAIRGAIMAPRHFRGKDRAFADRNPVGTGPYKFVRWIKDDRLELEANLLWWGGAPKVKTLVFRPIPEAAVRVGALQAGDIDIAVSIPPHLMNVIGKHPKLYVAKAPSVRTLFIPVYTYEFDAQNKLVGPLEGPTRDRRVRQALLAGVDADEIIRTVLEGQAVRTATPLTPQHFGFDKTIAPVRRDPDRVKKLLAEAGYPGGVDLTLNAPDGRYLKDKEVAEAVAGQLTKAGIRTRVRTFEWTTYLTQMAYVHKAGPMYLIGWGNTTWDADGTLFPLWRAGTQLCNNYNPDFDGLVDEAQSSVDPKRRLEIYARAQRLLLEDGAVIPLYQQMDLYGVNRRVSFEALSSEQIVGAWLAWQDGR